MNLVFCGYHKRVERAVKDIAIAAEMCGIKRNGPIILPTRKKRWSILRSPFVNKKSQEALALHTHMRLIQIEGDKDSCNRFVHFVLDTMEPILTLKVFETRLHELTKFWTFGEVIEKCNHKKETL